MTDTTPAQKLQHWLDFSETTRPGYDALSDVSYEVAPIKRAWLEDVLNELADLEARTWEQAAEFVNEQREDFDGDLRQVRDRMKAHAREIREEAS